MGELSTNSLVAASNVALVFGHEEFGVSVDVLEACDAVVEIPVYGLKNSLNVANVVAVALFDVVRRWRK